MSSIFRTINPKYWTTLVGHGEHWDREIVFFSSENPYLVADRGEAPLIFRANWGPKGPLIWGSWWPPPPPCLKVWIRHWYVASQHNEHRTNSITMHADKASINQRLVCEKFMAQHRRVMMATNKFLVTVYSALYFCVMLDIVYCNIT